MESRKRGSRLYHKDFNIVPYTLCVSSIVICRIVAIQCASSRAAFDFLKKRYESNRGFFGIVLIEVLFAEKFIECMKIPASHSCGNSTSSQEC